MDDTDYLQIFKYNKLVDSQHTLDFILSKSNLPQNVDYGIMLAYLRYYRRGARIGVNPSDYANRKYIEYKTGNIY